MIDKKYLNLNSIAKDIYTVNAKNGFWEDERNIGELLMLVTSELAEALEADRKSIHSKLSEFEGEIKKQPSESSYQPIFEQYMKEGFADELADAIIRILDMSEGLGIDIGKHVYYKLQYNKLRPYKHGKKY